MPVKQGGPGLDILLGGSGDDIIFGYDGNDMLFGFGGHDILKGGGGADTMRGGTGDDEYYVDDAGDLVIENAMEGLDEVYSSIDYALPAHVERLHLTGEAVHGAGNELTNAIWGNANDNVLKGYGGKDVLEGGEGADVLYGGDGDDHLLGGPGVDHLYGGDGQDDFIIDDPGDIIDGGAGYDKVFASIDFTLPSETEGLWMSGAAVVGIGNDFGNYITANDLDNVLYGLDGPDDIYGWGGDDTIDGGSDWDYLTGGTGRDTLIGGTGLDLFIWNEVAETGATEATADVIVDFNAGEGDLIYLFEVDANTGAPGIQDFTFIGMAAFSGTPGEIRYYHAGGNTFIQMQTGTSADVEGVICLEGILDPEASWFFL
jgi:Ca2+-binding RTX toxin-like protein